MHRGIILAGGSGTRLYPLTKGVSKQLMPVFDQQMVYYSLATSMLAGIREVLIITPPHDLACFSALVGDGSDWGMEFPYAAQPSLDGLAQAFHIGAHFLTGKSSALILGDNIFYGHGLSELLYSADNRTEGAAVFAYQVSNPKDYGVVSFDKNGRADNLEEKPLRPRSNYAVTGLQAFTGVPGRHL